MRWLAKETMVAFWSEPFEGEKGVYTDMEQWTRIRLELKHEDTSKREVMRREGIHWDTLQKIESHSEPPGYRMARVRPKPNPSLTLFSQKATKNG